MQAAYISSHIKTEWSVGLAP